MATTTRGRITIPATLIDGDWPPELPADTRIVVQEFAWSAGEERALLERAAFPARAPGGPVPHCVGREAIADAVRRA